MRFHDVAYLEVTPRFGRAGTPLPAANAKDTRGAERSPRPTGDALTVSVELTDFSVFYTQGILDSVAAELKEGKSDVVCDLRGDRGQLIKVSKDRKGVVREEVLTKTWTDWVDYWAVDFDYGSRKEIIKVERGTGIGGAKDELALRPEDFEERWTGGYIFENEWQSFRTRADRELELVSAPHTYARPGRYTIAVKVIDIFGNDTMSLVPVTVG